ncbi:unnamed protein product [Larinioides sclopetarius]|uniref:PWWP domain-containing protein n=1 Tax=Larinioides sclopetarius TaxID=280406 RepID=A0AAV2BPZ2_9ARAC
MEKEGPLSDCDSDSSDGLPELFPKHTFDVAKLTRNDIVWAAYKDLHWPALVRDVDKKNKKVRVWYLDSPGKCFNLPFKKIHDFVDSDFNKKVEDVAKNHPLGQKFNEVLRRTNLFIYRQFKGEGDDPLKFFNLSEPYFLLKDLSSGNSDNKIISVDVLSENVGDKNDNLKENSEDESDGETCTPSKYLSELYEEDSPYDDEMVDKILSCITSGHIDNYLIDIVSSKITNDRHELYVEAMEKGQIQLFVESQPSVPIKNRKLHSISIYLHSLYEQKIRNEKLNRLNEYIVSVWLPEAVNKAISLIETESVKPTDYLCGDNKSCSSLKTETEELTVSGSSNFSSSPIFVQSSKSPIDCDNKVSISPTVVEVLESLVDSAYNNISSPAFHVEPSESLVDSSSNNVLCAAKRKVNLRSSSLKSHNYNELEIEVCSPRKKKFTSRKKQKRSSKTLKRGKKTAQEIVSNSEDKA